jgi:hypothetical protein
MTVLTRCYKTLIPKEDYVADVLNGMPDLYGEFPLLCRRAARTDLPSTTRPILGSDKSHLLALPDVVVVDVDHGLPRRPAVLVRFHSPRRSHFGRVSPEPFSRTEQQDTPLVLTTRVRYRYTYFLGLPILMWVAIKYWAGARERSPVEIVSLYGYSSTVWILVAVSRMSGSL